MRKTPAGADGEKQTADRRRAERVMGPDGEERRKKGGGRRRREKTTEVPRSMGDSISKHVHTHVDHVGHVVDVILGHHGVGRHQVEQVVVAGFRAFELVLRVLGLPLERGEEREQTTRRGGGEPSVQEGKQTRAHECELS